jgi:hypothetical protein
MNKLFVLLLALAQPALAQDLLLQTRIEERTLSALIDKTRVLLNNAEIGDSMTGELDFNEDVTYTLNEFTTDPDYLKFKDLFSSIFKLDLSNALVRIRIPKIAYQVEKLHAKPHHMSVQDPTLTLDVTSYIQGVTTTLSAGIDMDLMIVNPKTNVPESYLTAHLVPTTIHIPNSLEPISFGLKFETKRDQAFTYNLKSYDLQEIPNYVNRHIKDIVIVEKDKSIPISANSLTVNPVIVRLSQLTRTIEFETFKPLLQKRLDKIVSSIISKLGQSLQSKIGPKILTSVFSNQTRSDLIIENEYLYTRFVTSSFSQPTSDQLYLGVTGELCTTESYRQYREQCNAHGNFPAPVRSISEGTRRKASSEITDYIARGKSDLILSVSEEYLNRLLHITIQANLWNESLEKENLALGPKGAFIVLDKRTNQPELYIDLLYYGEGKGIQNLVVNERNPIQFALRLSTSLEFKNTDGTPHMILKTLKILSDQNEIINGIPQYELSSRLLRGFKKKISRMILEMSDEIEGQTAVDLELPVLKNIDLEKSWYEASPFGRLNIFFNL